MKIQSMNLKYWSLKKMYKKKKKKKIEYRVGPPVSKKTLLKQLAKKRHLKLIINDGKKLN